MRHIAAVNGETTSGQSLTSPWSRHACRHAWLQLLTSISNFPHTYLVFGACDLLFSTDSHDASLLDAYADSHSTFASMMLVFVAAQNAGQ